MVKRKEPEEPVVETRSEQYTVSGPHRVAGVAPGESVSLDPDAPVTQRLLARGQVAVDSSRRQSGDVSSTEDAPVSDAPAVEEEV